MIVDNNTIQLYQKLLNQASLSPAIVSIHNCYNGGNNRTYKLETEEGTFAVKKYFRESKDNRDRLHSEFTFLSYAYESAKHYVPKPYSKDDENGVALYDFIDGESFKNKEITQLEIEQAIQFFCSLNDRNMRVSAKNLPLASEACFSLRDHIKLIDLRIDHLKHHIRNEKNLEVHAVIPRLENHWIALNEKILTYTKKNKIDLNALLPQTQWCVSPSDFGFHNAILKKNKKICFLDFEYAGWDDPARMVGDFFSQLANPISPKFYDEFVNAVMLPFPDPEMLIKRAEILKLIYRVKWCCIILNIFIPVNLSRRQFANPNLDVENLKLMQLVKAKYILQQMEKGNELY